MCYLYIKFCATIIILKLPAIIILSNILSRYQPNCLRRAWTADISMAPFAGTLPQPHKRLNLRNLHCHLHALYLKVFSVSFVFKSLIISHFDKYPMLSSKQSDYGRSSSFLSSAPPLWDCFRSSPKTKFSYWFRLIIFAPQALLIPSSQLHCDSLSFPFGPPFTKRPTAVVFRHFPSDPPSQHVKYSICIFWVFKQVHISYQLDVLVSPITSTSIKNHYAGSHPSSTHLLQLSQPKVRSKRPVTYIKLPTYSATCKVVQRCLLLY